MVDEGLPHDIVDHYYGDFFLVQILQPGDHLVAEALPCTMIS